MKNGHTILRKIHILSWWKNRNVAFFVTPANLIIFLCTINWLHDSPLETRSLLRTKETLIRNLLHHIDATSYGKELNIREFTIEERIHWVHTPFLFKISDFPPQQKPNPQACDPLGDSCIYCKWYLWGGCTLKLTTWIFQGQAEVVLLSLSCKFTRTMVHKATM